MSKTTKIIDDLSKINQDFGLIIGNFDGFHLGHQRLVSNFIRNCKNKNLISVALTFNPHPVVFVKNIQSDYHLMSFDQRNEEVLAAGIETIAEMTFDESIQQLSAKDFLLNHLLKNQHLKYVHLGHDFKLGKGKSDAKKELEFLVEGKSIEVTQEEVFKHEEEIVSSTKIRNMLKVNLVDARKFLGRNYYLEGRVKSGKGIGKKKLFATANLDYPELSLIPALGVYITRLQVDGRSYDSITNIGKNPTIADDNALSIETHLLFHQEDLYDKKITIEFISKIREEKKFAAIEDLRAQIKMDVENTKKYFRSQSKIKLALIGKNISHSKSQDMYEELLGNAVNYTLIDCASESDIPLTKDLMENYLGVSITAPYKKCMAARKEILNEFPDGINAIYSDKNEFRGLNTDLSAISEILNSYLVKDLKVLILGSGTMAKVTEELLKKDGVEYELLSRKNNKLFEVNEYLSDSGRPLLVINTCSREYSFRGTKDFHYRFWDMNYNLEKHAEYFKDSPVEYVDGLTQLKLQAKYALNYWNLI